MNNNTPSTGNPSSPKYKGVRKRKWGKWVSEIRLPNSRDRIWLGSYDTPEKAARAFDAAQFCLRGPTANFNFPDNPPEIAGGRSMTPDEIRAAAARFANLPVENEVSITSCSPLISDVAATSTAQMESDGVGLESSFYDHLSLSTTLGSGNYTSDFGLFSGFDHFNSSNFFSPQPQPENNNFIYDHNDEDNYDASIYQNAYLWSF